jgi:hypothetical protein
VWSSARSSLADSFWVENTTPWARAVRTELPRVAAKIGRRIGRAARPATKEFGAVTDTFTGQPGFTVAIVASGCLVVGIAANRVDDYVARKFCEYLR